LGVEAARQEGRGNTANMEVRVTWIAPSGQ